MNAENVKLDGLVFDAVKVGHRKFSAIQTAMPKDDRDVPVYGVRDIDKSLQRLRRKGAIECTTKREWVEKASACI